MLARERLTGMAKRPILAADEPYDKNRIAEQSASGELLQEAVSCCF